MKRKELNSASMPVWYEFNKDEKNQALSEKIMFMSGSYHLSDEEVIYLNSLIEEEAILLEKAKEDTIKNNKVSHRINEYLQELKDNDRLVTLFSNIAMSRFLSGDYKDVEDVDASYHDLRLEDVDIVGHDELNETYNKLIDVINDLDFMYQTNENEPCTVENCLYCTPPSEEEKQNALDSLEGDGYFNLPPKDALIELMVIIHRYERRNQGFFGDIDDDDEED